MKQKLKELSLALLVGVIVFTAMAYVSQFDMISVKGMR